MDRAEGLFMAIKRWQDWVNLVLGLWLFVSPMAMGYVQVSAVAAWNAGLLGAAIVILAIVAMNRPRAWEEAINVVLGLWLMVSPWALGFEQWAAARSTAMWVGLLVAVFAIWAMIMDTDVRRWLHEHHLMR
jgi:hypothetical protein